MHGVRRKAGSDMMHGGAGLSARRAPGPWEIGEGVDPADLASPARALQAQLAEAASRSFATRTAGEGARRQPLVGLATLVGLSITGWAAVAVVGFMVFRIIQAA